NRNFFCACLGEWIDHATGCAACTDNQDVGIFQWPVECTNRVDQTLPISISAMQNAIFHPQGIHRLGNFGPLTEYLTLGKSLLFKWHGDIHPDSAMGKKLLNIGLKAIQRSQTFAVI